MGALHNISSELGIDIVFPENYSIFIIYERDQAIDYGHTDNLYIAVGYLPSKDTEYAFTLNGSAVNTTPLFLWILINGPVEISLFGMKFPWGRCSVRIKYLYLWKCESLCRIDLWLSFTYI